MLGIGQHIGIPHLIGKAGGMGPQPTQRDRAPGRAQDRLAGGIETFQHPGRRQGRNQPAQIVVQPQPPLFHQLHAAGRGDRLGHGRDPEHAVRLHRRATAQGAFAEHALVDQVLAIGGHRHHAGNSPGFGDAAQGGIDIGACGHVVFPNSLPGVGRAGLSKQSQPHHSTHAGLAQCRAGASPGGRIQCHAAPPNSITLRTVSPRFSAAKPSLISSNRMRAEIISSNRNLPSR